MARAATGIGISTLAALLLLMAVYYAPLNDPGAVALGLAASLLSLTVLVVLWMGRRR